MNDIKLQVNSNEYNKLKLHNFENNNIISAEDNSDLDNINDMAALNNISSMISIDSFKNYSKLT